MTKPARIGRFSLGLCLLAALLLMSACGPKDIESKSSYDEAEARGAHEPDAFKEMRYPVAGLTRGRDYYFYRINQPAIMQNVQQWQREQFLHSLGFRAGPEMRGPEHPSYREVPKERSPFMQ